MGQFELALLGWRHPECSRISGGAKDLIANGPMGVENSRPADESAGLRDDAVTGESSN